MTAQDISNIRRFIGVVEGVAISLPTEAQSLLYDYIEVVDAIIDREENGGERYEIRLDKHTAEMV